MILSKRQRKASRKLFRNNGGAIWWRVGEGKTRIIYNWFAMIAKPTSTFVVVCRREAFADWVEETVKCNLPWTVVDFEKDLCRSSKIKVWLVSHGMLAALLTQLKEQAHKIEAVAFDEGFLYKNNQTEHCKAAHILSEVVGNAAILSGSVMTAKNLEDVFGQLYAINKHDCIARTLTEFRTRYMARYQIHPDRQVFGFCARKDATDKVSEKIRRIVSVNFPSGHARKITEDVHWIEPSEQQRYIIRKLKDEYFVSLKGKDLELRNAPSLITKCQQISDGWIRMNPVKRMGIKLEDGPIMFVDSSKLAYLRSKVLELVECGERVVIWCAFRYSVFHVLQSLQKLKLKAYAMTGGEPFDLAGWKRNGQVAVCTEASGSSVNHFEQCAYAIYYSMDFSWRNLVQSRGRTDRKSSRHNECFYYYFQTRGTLDSFVRRTALSSGAREQELLIQVKSWLSAEL